MLFLATYQETESVIFLNRTYTLYNY